LAGEGVAGADAGGGAGCGLKQASIVAAAATDVAILFFMALTKEGRMQTCCNDWDEINASRAANCWSH